MSGRPLGHALRRARGPHPGPHPGAVPATASPPTAAFRPLSAGQPPSTPTVLHAMIILAAEIPRPPAAARVRGDPVNHGSTTRQPSACAPIPPPAHTTPRLTALGHARPRPPDLENRHAPLEPGWLKLRAFGLRTPDNPRRAGTKPLITGGPTARGLYAIGWRAGILRSSRRFGRPGIDAPGGAPGRQRNGLGAGVPSSTDHDHGIVRVSSMTWWPASGLVVCGPADGSDLSREMPMLSAAAVGAGCDWPAQCLNARLDAGSVW